MPKPEHLKWVRLEHKEGNHNKFYELIISTEIEEDELIYFLVSSWGKIGYNPSTQTKLRTTSKGTVERRFRDLQNAKLSKGYRIVESAEGRKVTKILEEDLSFKGHKIEQESKIPIKPKSRFTDFEL